MSLDDVTSVDAVGADAAVVGSLGAGEAVLGPAEGVVVLVEQRVLLLDAEPRLLVLGAAKRERAKLKISLHQFSRTNTIF